MAAAVARAVDRVRRVSLQPDPMAAMGEWHKMERRAARGEMWDLRAAILGHMAPAAAAVITPQKAKLAAMGWNGIPHTVPAGAVVAVRTAPTWAREMVAYTVAAAAAGTFIVWGLEVGHKV